MARIFKPDSHTAIFFSKSRFTLSLLAYFVNHSSNCDNVTTGGVGDGVGDTLGEEEGVESTGFGVDEALGMGLLLGLFEITGFDV